MKNNTKETETILDTDLVIIGGGGAGLSAAMAAAEAGCKNIVILEKLNATGGNFIIYGGIFAAESPVQRRAAFVDAGRDYYFNTAMRWSHWKINPRIIRAFIDKSGDTIKWLESKGITFELARVYCNQDRLSFHYPKSTSGDISKGCSEMMRIMEKSIKDLGIQILVNTRAKKVIKDQGQVSGVLAETDGREFLIKTKSAIIATGGFGRNNELLKLRCKNYHDTMEYRGVPNTGDGIQLATEIGASVEDSSILLVGPPLAVKSEPMMIGETEPGTTPYFLSNIIWEPYIFFVNKNGEQFMGYDDACPPEFFVERTYAMVQQPEGISYAIFDDKMRQILEEKGNPINRRSGAGAPIEELPGLSRELRKQADKGKLKMSNSWSEIANWMKVAPQALQKSINEYNDACDKGCDPIFAKDRKYLLPLRTPPYYAIECHCYFLDTLGGIKINEQMEVLDNELNPIQGLYAAGSTTSGWEGEVYCYLLSGEARSFALNSGRIAGENAAKYLSR